ncbi:MAG: hypothetical protein ABIL25_07135 [candidate division WOR-3 bacterium]
MKSLRFLVLSGIAAAGLLVFVQSCGTLAGPPASVQLGPDTSGTGVMVVWTPPAENTPDKYRVYFAPLTETTFQLIAETTATSIIHDPHDTTGTYVVAAVFGDREYRSEKKLTTIPVFGDTVAVAELDASGNSGYGWNRVGGAGRTCSMLSLSSTSVADFYITDHKPGSGSLPYAIASPNKGPSDPAGPLVPPSDDWRINWFTDPLSSEHRALPPVTETNYFDYTELTGPVPVVIGCATEDNYFGLVKITKVDAGVGEVRLVSWFQLVPGLRLMMHRAD